MTYKDFGTNINDAIASMQRSAEFQLLHNELRGDFGELYKITAEAVNAGKKCPELIRACIRELFSLIEADIYYLNHIEPYKGYKDRDGLIDKFKKTYKYHCQNHNHYDLYTTFLKDHYSDFKVLKLRRDSITHPKKMENLQVDNYTFEQTHKLFKAYTDFVAGSMQDVGVSFKSSDFNDFFKIYNKKNNA